MNQRIEELKKIEERQQAEFNETMEKRKHLETLRAEKDLEVETASQRFVELETEIVEAIVSAGLNEGNKEVVDLLKAERRRLQEVLGDAKFILPAIQERLKPLQEDARQQAHSLMGTQNHIAFEVQKVRFAEALAANQLNPNLISDFKQAASRADRVRDFEGIIANAYSKN